MLGLDRRLEVHGPFSCLRFETRRPRRVYVGQILETYLWFGKQSDQLRSS